VLFTRKAQVAGLDITVEAAGEDPKSVEIADLVRECVSRDEFEIELRDIHELAGLVIEQLDWSAFIDRYDGRKLCFYLDPPYFGSESDYGKSCFGRDQFQAIATRLRGLKGRFILSINDVPEIRETFRRGGGSAAL